MAVTVRAFFFFAFLSTTLQFSTLIIAVDFNYPAIFNFGDSNSDTGELVAGKGLQLDLPNGVTYFHKRSGRFCDGRLIIDFLMNGMELPFLNAYLDSVGAPNFKKGCNFAAAGSTILPANASSVNPFSLGIQVAQFFRFKARVLELLGGKVDKFLPAENYFRRGLYMFDIGQNDLAGAFYSKSEDQVVASIPTILSEFEQRIKKREIYNQTIMLYERDNDFTWFGKTPYIYGKKAMTHIFTLFRELYDQGARNYWIHNTGPLGCLPQVIATFGTDPSKLDELGCVSSHKRAAQLFNLQLHALCRKFQGEFKDANVTHVDVFTIKLNLISNFSQYGFEHPITACCGYGGPPLNYDSRISCGQTKNLNGSMVTAMGCNDTTEYINWDGVHYTEAANLYVSSQILTGKYTDPPLSDRMPFLHKLKIY